MPEVSTTFSHSNNLTISDTSKRPISPLKPSDQHHAKKSTPTINSGRYQLRSTPVGQEQPVPPSSRLPMDPVESRDALP